MKIGIDISQLAYPNTGVANYLQNLVENLIKQDRDNNYILFFSSLRGRLNPVFAKEIIRYDNVQLRQFYFPPTMLDFIWNRFHIMPIETFIGEIDVFLTSDWIEPPTRKAKKVTIFYDFIVYRYPEETAQIIINTQKRKLGWAKKECDSFICISEATKKDAMQILGIDEKRLKVVYPGI